MKISKSLKDAGIGKRFWVMMTGILVVILVEYIPALKGHENMLIYILGLLGTFVIGQSISDNGKYRK